MYTWLVYGLCMTRTNIDVDDELVAEVMRRHNLKTKKDAIDFALRKAAPKITTKDVLALQGVGWEGDLEEMRRGSDPERKWRSS